MVRYGIGLWFVERLGAGFPFHTLFINITGSLAIGILLTIMTEWLLMDPAWRLLLVVGFLGGYTTFSSFTYETLALVESGNGLRAILYVLASNGLGLLAAILGIVLARGLTSLKP